MSTSIVVARAGEATADPEAYTVTVTDEDGSTTTHHVTLQRSTFGRLARDGESAHAFVQRSIEFLVAREPKESILRRFDIDVIATYFPEFPAEISSP